MGPITGKPVRFPPGRLAIRLGEEHWFAYRLLYGRYQSYLAGLPVLRARDFDGRAVMVTREGLDALNRGFASLRDGRADTDGSPFGGQAQTRTRLFKRLQSLS